MRAIVFLYVLLTVVRVAAQSSVSNPGYNPQPRILLPVVIPREMIITAETQTYWNVNVSSNYYPKTVTLDGELTLYFDKVETNGTFATGYPNYTNSMPGVPGHYWSWEHHWLIDGWILYDMIGPYAGSGYYTNVNFECDRITADNLPFETLAPYRIEPNPLASVPYADFVLKCVDQSGHYAPTNDPVLWVFSSALPTWEGRKGTCDIFYQEASLAWPEKVQRRLYSQTNKSLVVSTSGAACAVEVYPHVTPANAAWMRQGADADVKWMCLLSNGIDFYRSEATGEPVWFNVQVDWVNERPKEGVF